MSTHTPGPWKVLDYFAPQSLDQVKMQYAVLVEAKPSWLCYAFHEGDARLMAAAPDLLEAMQLMVARFEPNAWANELKPKEVLDIARAAIAKATGEA